MKDLDSVARALAQSGRRGELEALASSAEGRALEGMVDGEALERAVSRGDAAALKEMLASLLATPEGRRLAQAEGVSRKLHSAAHSRASARRSGRGESVSMGQGSAPLNRIAKTAGDPPFYVLFQKGFSTRPTFL